MNILFPVPAGQNGYTPNVRMLDATTESLDTVLRPGFLNGVISAGNPIDPKDMLLVSYENGTEWFVQNISNGVISLVLANNTTNFPFTNVQFVAQGGSDLNAGNTFNSPKATVQAAISAVTAGGLVWVLDSQVIENQPITLNKGFYLYAPNATFIIDAVSGSLFTQADTGGEYIVNITAQTIEAGGGASYVTQNGSFSVLILNAAEIVGPATFNGIGVFNTLNLAGTLNMNATSRGIFEVASTGGGFTLNAAIGSIVTGKIGNSFYDTQTFLNQIISQQQESQETAGRTLTPNDSNTTVNYMNTVTGNYIFPATGIPVGTKISFIQLSSGVVEFDSDGTSTILSTVLAPVVTNGVNAKAYAEQISLGVWVIDGNVIGSGP